MRIPDFTDGGRFPFDYSTEGENASPPIFWLSAPENAAAFAVVLEDLDAAEGEARYHWLVYNIPARAEGLPAELPEGYLLPGGIEQAKTDFGQPAYHGPEPVSGSHTYRFSAYALNSKIEVDPRWDDAADVAAAIETAALATATLEGTR